MKNFSRAVAALSCAVACAVVVGGCGTDTGRSGTNAADTSTSPTSAADTSAAETSSGGAGATPAPRQSSAIADRSGSSVMAVSYRRSGGLKAMTVSRVFRADAPPPQGFTATEVDGVLEAAQALVAAHAHVMPLPANTCCDRYVYNVTITLADGTTVTFTTVDGLQQPIAFDSLLSRLA